MGLDFSHGDAHFGYAQFNRIMRMIEGYTLHLEDIFKKPLAEGEEYDWEKNHPDVVETIKAIKVLVKHNGCDGELSVPQMEKLYPILNTIICDWDNDKVALSGFAGAIKDAIDSGEPLKFL